METRDLELRYNTIVVPASAEFYIGADYMIHYSYARDTAYARFQLLLQTVPTARIDWLSLIVHSVSSGSEPFRRLTPNCRPLMPACIGRIIEEDDSDNDVELDSTAPVPVFPALDYIADFTSICHAHPGLIVRYFGLRYEYHPRYLRLIYKLEDILIFGVAITKALRGEDLSFLVPKRFQGIIEHLEGQQNESMLTAGNLVLWPFDEGFREG